MAAFPGMEENSELFLTRQGKANDTGVVYLLYD